MEQIALDHRDLARELRRLADWARPDVDRIALLQAAERYEGAARNTDAETGTVPPCK